MSHRKPVYLVPVMRVSMQNKILAESIAHRLIPWRGKETQFWRLRSLFLWVARMYGSAKMWFSKFCSHACPTGRHDLEKIRFPCPRLAFKTGLEKKTTKTIHLLRKNCGQFKRELFFLTRLVRLGIKCVCAFHSRSTMPVEIWFPPTFF